jgi:hypothetical protein
MPTRGQARKRSWLYLGATIWAGTACSNPALVTENSTDPGFHIEPANPILTAGGALQFRAFTPRGSELPVLWRLQNPEFGTVSSAGLLSTCWASGPTQLTAKLQTDTTRQASTRITLSQPAVALIGVTGLHYTATAAPARLDSVAGGIDAKVNVAAGIMACREVTAVRLELLGSGAPILLAQASFTPLLTTTLTLSLHWNAAAFPPGPYAIWAVMSVRDRGEIMSAAIPIHVSP